MDDEDCDEEFCADCRYAYYFREIGEHRVNSCDVYPEEGRGYWFSDMERPGCGKYERRTHIKYIAYNQLKEYNPM